MKITRLGLDLAKNVIQMHAVNTRGEVMVRKAFSRIKLMAYMQGLEPCLVGMEACAGAHHWARCFQAMGHEVVLIAPHHVKPYVLGQKNDANDAAGICEAITRPPIPHVAIKTQAQQDIQALHRIRSDIMKTRTAKVNQVRGLLAEHGIVIAKSIYQCRRALPGVLEDGENGLSFGFRTLLSGLHDDLLVLDHRIAQLDAAVHDSIGQHDVARRLCELPGIGPISASAMLTVLSDEKQAANFKNGRQFAAFLGLTPRQHSSGGKNRLLGIHKHGNSYLRGLLIHGARSVQRVADKRTDIRSQWLVDLGKRRHRNIATVAMANKTARTAWAIVRYEQTYQAR
ncbi:MAG: IS110 family transposase [Arenimonas sp.]